MPISLSEARALYDAGAPVARVAGELGLTVRAFRTLRERNGWPMRPAATTASAARQKPPNARATKAKGPKRTASAKPKSARPKRVTSRPVKGAAAAPPDAPHADAPRLDVSPVATDASAVDVPAIRRQLQQRLQKEIAGVGARFESGSEVAAERTARMLASLVKSLAELRRLEALDPSDEGTSGDADERDERPPRDLETLREELSRALERLSHEPAPRGS